MEFASKLKLRSTLIGRQQSDGEREQPTILHISKAGMGEINLLL